VNYLIDTHILIWAFLDTSKLSPGIKAILLDGNNFIYYSPISLWEISIKYGLKKLSLGGGAPEDLFEEISNSFLLCKPLDNSNVITNYKLPIRRKDPFARLLVWEAIKNDFTLLSADKEIGVYKKDGLKVVW
jgi:PIN domain nuclease of toxin-antitoxin system